ncbi:MAG: glycosyl hydrolase 108 family protein [Bacteroidales bacterium]
MITFEESFTKLLGHEGGYVNNPKDPGGETNWGISKRSYPNEDIKNLTQGRAKEIYYKDFWLPCHLDKLPTEVRFDLFDAAVNSGPEQAIKWLQEAVGVTQDGAVGPITEKVCSILPGGIIHARFNGVRLEFMTDLNTWATFGKGWARRVAKNLQGV